MLNPFEHPLMSRRLNYYARLRKLSNYLQEHPDGVITLGQAAQIACMERTAFSKFFKRSTGITFRAFVQQWRVAGAIRQMLNTDSSLATIAFGAGFGNMNSFGRIFRKLTGETPSRYRKRLLTSNGLLLNDQLIGKSSAMPTSACRIEIVDMDAL
jgi:AraC-like DNA-binding protein